MPRATVAAATFYDNSANPSNDEQDTISAATTDTEHFEFHDDESNNNILNELVMSTGGNLLSLWAQLALKSHGVRTWPLIHPASHLPTAAHTHPDMFKSFHTQKHLYDFHQVNFLMYIIESH